MKRFYYENISHDSKEILISGNQAHHIKNVLRIKDNETVIITNGKGFDFTGEITYINKKEILFKIESADKGTKDSDIEIDIAFSLLKGKKNDELIKPLTETGINKILPFISQRTVSAPPKNKQVNKVERWQEIAKESIKQCERSVIPHIEDIAEFFEILNISRNYDLKILFYERSSIPLKNINNKYNNPKKILIMLGPEGGFTEDEVNMCEKYGFEQISLGPRILRAQTACVCASFLCQHLFGDIV